MNPILSAFRSLCFFITGRLRFDRSRIGWTFTDPRGQTFRAFRFVSLNLSSEKSIPGAIFIPHFHVSGIPPRANILFSLLPMWFFMGLPGFRSKYWMMDEKSGDFCGYYEWDSVENAQAYADSFAMRFMTRRSLPESVWCNVYAREDAPAAPMKP